MRRMMFALALVLSAGVANADEGYTAPWKTFRVFESTVCLGDVPPLVSCDLRIPTLQFVPEEEGRVVLSGTTFCIGRAAKGIACDVRIPPQVKRPKVDPDSWVEKMKSRLKRWDAKAREVNESQ